jgi:hypothetical protein
MKCSITLQSFAVSAIFIKLQLIVQEKQQISCERKFAGIKKKFASARAFVCSYISTLLLKMQLSSCRSPYAT